MLSKLVEIKYLRVPEKLLDEVKEEQNRAREASRSARGGHASGGQRGMFILICMCISFGLRTNSCTPSGRGAPIRGTSV